MTCHFYGGPWDGLVGILPVAHREVLIDTKGTVCVLLLGAAALAHAYKTASAEPSEFSRYVCVRQDADSARYCYRPGLEAGQSIHFMTE